MVAIGCARRASKPIGAESRMPSPRSRIATRGPATVSMRARARARSAPTHSRRGALRVGASGYAPDSTRADQERASVSLLTLCATTSAARGPLPSPAREGAWKKVPGGDAVPASRGQRALAGGMTREVARADLKAFFEPWSTSRSVQARRMVSDDVRAARDRRAGPRRSACCPRSSRAGRRPGGRT